jgi:hypothetical protein
VEVIVDQFEIPSGYLSGGFEEYEADVSITEVHI